jgi:hypothetical protein
MLQAGGSRVRFPMRSLVFPIYLILPAANNGPGDDSASNRMFNAQTLPGSLRRIVRRQYDASGEHAPPSSGSKSKPSNNNTPDDRTPYNRRDENLRSTQ